MTPLQFFRYLSWSIIGEPAGRHDHQKSQTGHDEQSNFQRLKFADIVAVDGNPLENFKTLRTLGFVMKNGRVYRNDWEPDSVKAQLPADDAQSQPASAAHLH